MTIEILKRLSAATLVLLIATGFQTTEAKPRLLTTSVTKEKKQSADIAGIVFDMQQNSTWKAVKQKRETRLVVGSGVPLDSQLKKTSSGKGWILIGFLDGTERKYDLDDKSDVQSMPVDRNENSFSRFASAWVDVLTKSPDRFVSALSRDTNSPKDGVVELTSDGVLLDKVLPRGLLGDHLFSIAPLSGSDTDAEQIKVNIQKNQIPLLKVSGLQPGIYRLRRLDTSAAHKPTGDDAWLLLCSSEDFKNKIAEFQKGVDDVDQWCKNAPNSVRRGIVRAHLQSLADGRTIEKLKTGAAN